MTVTPSAGIVFAMLFLLLACVCTVWSLLSFARARQSLHWPRAQARISTCKLQRYRHPSSGYKDTWWQEWSFQVLYDYSVQGQAYQGYLPFFGGSPGKRVARNIVAKYPQGSAATIAYHPENPRISVLIPGVNRYTWSALLSGPFMLALAYVAWRYF